MAIFLIPCPIFPGNIQTIPPATIDRLHEINHFIVERAKTARHFIKDSQHPTPLQEIDVFELDKHDPENGLKSYLHENAFKYDIGVVSEAGCPGVADPGSTIVAWAHEQNIKVVPLVGPSSILMAIMGSGFSGQQFTFHGYLPQQKDKLIKKLKDIELDSHKNGLSNVFIETPYRNRSLIITACSCLKPHTLMSVSLDLTGDKQEVKTLSIKDWKGQNLDKYHKQPAVFVIGRSKFL
jgi:16S rRNA (cytidine1402-2'-O)-methyltransferase